MNYTLHAKARRVCDRDKRNVPADNSRDKSYVPAESFGLVTSFTTTEETALGRVVEVTVKNTSGEDFLGVVELLLTVPQENPKFFLPGYMYNRNTGEKSNSGRKEFPRIREVNCKRPESTFWMTRSDRLAEPMSLIYDKGRVVGLAASPYFVGDAADKHEADLQSEGPEPFYRYSGFTLHCSEEGKASVGYTLGYENAPWLFIQTAKVLERAPLTEENSFAIAAGEEVKVTLRVYDYAAESELAIHDAVKDAYFTYHQAPRALEGMDVKKAAGILAGAIRDYAYLPEDKMYSGFVYDRPEGLAYNKLGSLSWTNGLTVAVPQLLAAGRCGDEVMRTQALTVMEEIMKNAYNPRAGLLYDAFVDGKWTARGWWYDGMHNGGHSSYLNGQAIYYILKAYLFEKEMGHGEHTEWISFVKPVVEKLATLKNTVDEYPFSMSEEDGSALEYDSMSGAWCLAAAAMYAHVSGDVSDLAGLIKSEQHYYDAFISKVECYGGPLDTDKAVDSEGVLAYIRAARLMHVLTGEEKYLEHLRDAIYYELTFKLGYNTPVKVKPLKELGWSSSGGSITSTANPHIHPMSSTVVDEMLYYVKHMNDAYVSERIKDTLGWGMQTFNTYDREYGYGFVGWMSERWCFCEGLVVEKYPDGTPAGTWFALMPWASASVIEGFVGDAWDEA